MSRRVNDTTIREVVQETAATAVLDAEFAKYPNLKEVYRSLEWRIAREPEAGHRIPGSDPIAYVIHAESWVETPELVLLYRFDAVKVFVLFARTLPVPDSASRTYPKAAGQ